MKISGKWIIAVVCVFVLGLLGFAVNFGRKPFAHLKSSEIASASVRLTPPDRKIQIMDTEELTEYLRNVVIYNKDNSYTEYAGQGVVFTLTMADGVQMEIMEYNPFLVIDGVGYKTKYEPCEALNQYANELLDVEDAL